MVTPCTDNSATPHQVNPAEEFPLWQLCVRVPPELAPPPQPDEWGTMPPRMPVDAEFDRFRHGIPTRGHAVYAFVDHDDRVLYVGQSRQPRVRIRTHWRTQMWWLDVAEILLWLTADELAARELEYRLTELLAPRHSQVTDFEVGLLDRLRMAVL